MEAIVRQKQAEQDSEKEEDEEDDLGGSGEIAPQMVNESAHFFVVFTKMLTHTLPIFFPYYINPSQAESDHL